MTGFDPRTSGIGSDRSTNWATTTALIVDVFEISHKIFTLNRIDAAIVNLSSVIFTSYT